MRGPRRSIIACFATLLVWLTALSSTPAALSREQWRLDPIGEHVPTISAAVSRSVAIVTRETTRLPVLSHEITGFIAPRPVLALPANAAPRAAHAIHSRVRLSQGLQSTYDANAPPVAL
jgi:hypothetical protein